MPITRPCLCGADKRSNEGRSSQRSGIREMSGARNFTLKFGEGTRRSIQSAKSAAAPIGGRRTRRFPSLFPHFLPAASQLTGPEVAIVASYVRAWRLALRRGWQWVLILEDDAQFTRGSISQLLGCDDLSFSPGEPAVNTYTAGGEFLPHE